MGISNDYINVIQEENFLPIFCRVLKFVSAKGVRRQTESPEHSGGVVLWPSKQTAIMQHSPNNVSRDLG